MNAQNKKHESIDWEKINARCPNCAHFETGAIDCKEAYDLNNGTCIFYLPIKQPYRDMGIIRYE